MHQKQWYLSNPRETHCDRNLSANIQWTEQINGFNGNTLNPSHRIWTVYHLMSNTTDGHRWMKCNQYKQQSGMHWWGKKMKNIFLCLYELSVNVYSGSKWANIICKLFWGIEILCLWHHIMFTIAWFNFQFGR